MCVLYLKIVFVIDVCVFEEVDGVLMKLILPDLISHFQNLLVEKGLAVLAE